jgi:regulatory protein YycH of two-component signal transduction system YycFG
MKEQMKSTLLILLVFTSIFLTWEITTYQPKYDYILPTEYVAHEGLAQKKESNELIRPEMIMYHFGEGEHTVSYPEMFQYSVIQRQMPNWYFYSFRKIEEEQYKQWQEMINQYEGIEFSFSTGVPFQLLTDNFQIRMEESDLPLVNRIWIYQDKLTKEVHAMFISTEEQSMVRARTGISVRELGEYLTLGENRPFHEAHVLVKPEVNGVYPVHYLSTEPTEIKEYRYFYQRIPIETMIPYLFVDPTLVRQIQDRSGDSFYTDGSRGVQLHQSQLNMYYFHPLPDQPAARQQTENYVQRSIQFVNQHKGWDQPYYLYNIEKNTPEDHIEVQFRKYIGNFPVVDEYPEKDQNMIQLEVQFDRVVGYNRPLIEIDRVMDQVSRELPPGTKVIEYLKEENLPLEEIEKIFIGYKSEIQEYYVSYIPHWVVQWENGEQLFIKNLDYTKEEEKADELESN